MQRERLTPDRIRRFSCPADVKQSFLWDTDAPRLAVRATTGAKSFIFEAKMNRQTIRVTIGDVRAWNLDDARTEARRLQTLTDQGIDPRQEKADKLAAIEAKQAESARQEVTVGEAWAAYVVARSHKWGESSQRDHAQAIKPGGERITRGRKAGQGEYTLPGMVHPLLPVRLLDLTPARITTWMQDNNARGATQAAKIFRLVRAFLGWCAERPEYAGLVHADACRTSEVRDQVQAVKTKGDSLRREQLSLWFEHVRKLANPVQAAYLQALLLTGARREELAGLKWADVDFQWKSLHIADKVEDEGRIIPLTPFVASLLASLPRRNEWVFSSPTSSDGRIVEVLKPLRKAMESAGLPPFSLHDLRRSFGTLAEWCEVPVGVVAQIQGHKPSALAEKHYRRRPLDLLTLWHVKIEGWILEQAGIEQPGEGLAPGLRVVG